MPAAATPDDSPGLIVRQTAPLNLEMPFATLDDWIVPQDRFYVRNHFATPALQAANWALTADGAVDRPIRLTLGDLAALPQTTFAAAMECAGNGRVYYEPVREGLQWQNGAVGNASWRGVLLKDVLARTGVAADAMEVVLVGADRGVVDGGKKTASPGPIAFARSLPLAKALETSVLLATHMNGEPLTAEHGFPLRAVVGGWYGMAWVKWITGLHVVTTPFNGYWQARDYFHWDRSLGEPALVPLTEMEVKAQIARPAQGARVAAGRPLRVFGAAWSGESPVTRVEVDAGQGWQAATLLGEATPYGWRLWETMWTPPATGAHRLRCRAIDAAGRTQPEHQLPDRESYGANWSVPVEVRAVAPETAEADFVI